MTITFDESLPALITLIERHLGSEHPGKGVVLREATGSLTFFVDAELTSTEIKRVSAILRKELGPYARIDRVLADRRMPGAESVLRSPDARPVEVKTAIVRLIDRRIVGADWLRGPDADSAIPPRVVFASMKGGVGRSTALAVVAADWARQNRNVLVIDMDLEAPGIGSMLLEEDRRPQYGVIDYLVERKLARVSEEFMTDMIGTSQLTAGAGLVHVVPVVGKLGYDNPSNFTAKLARAMIDDVGDDGNRISLSQQVLAMVEGLASRHSYDAILVDARAGLSELTAGPVLGLCAHVLLFGTAQRQTFEAYRYLLSHLSAFALSGRDLAWRQRLKPVQSKASLSNDALELFRDELWELFGKYLYDEEEEADLNSFNFDAEDETAPHYPLVIPHSELFVDFDPVTAPNQLSFGFYNGTFGPFIQGLEKLIEIQPGASS